MYKINDSLSFKYKVTPKSNQPVQCIKYDGPVEVMKHHCVCKECWPEYYKNKRKEVL